VGNVTNLETSNELIWDEVSDLRGNVINLETSNALIWNLQGNVINLETSNELIWDEVSDLRGNVINLETSNALIWNLQGNVINLETSNELIWDEVSELSGNVINLETSNALLWNLPIVANTSTLTGVIQGDLLYASQDNQITTLTLSGTDGHVLTANLQTGLPAWKAPIGGGTTLQNITENGGFTGISNTDPQYTLQVGSNVVIDDTGSYKLYVVGNVYVDDHLDIFGFVRANKLDVTDFSVKNTRVVATQPLSRVRQI
jgi:hypothetical protein